MEIREFLKLVEAGEVTGSQNGVAEIKYFVRRELPVKSLNVLYIKDWLTLLKKHPPALEGSEYKFLEFLRLILAFDKRYPGQKVWEEHWEDIFTVLNTNIRCWPYWYKNFERKKLMLEFIRENNRVISFMEKDEHVSSVFLYYSNLLVGFANVCPDVWEAAYSTLAGCKDDMKALVRFYQVEVLRHQK